MKKLILNLASAPLIWLVSASAAPALSVDQEKVETLPTTTEQVIASAEKRFPLRAVPRWLGMVPRRSFQRWLKKDRGIYLSNRGSVLGPYYQLSRATRGGRRPAWLPRALRNSSEPLETHHLIERRMARAFGVDQKDLPSVLIPRSLHRGRRTGLHTVLSNLIPGSGRRYRQQLARIQQAYRNAYASRGDWGDAITAFMQSWHSRSIHQKSNKLGLKTYGNKVSE